MNAEQREGLRTTRPRQERTKRAHRREVTNPGRRIRGKESQRRADARHENPPKREQQQRVLDLRVVAVERDARAVDEQIEVHVAHGVARARDVQL
jgi:hypothetical protein